MRKSLFNVDSKSAFYFFPIYILLLFPFPSKLVGYSTALYLNDFVLIAFMAFTIIIKKYSFPKNTSFNLFCCFLVLNSIGIATLLIKGNLASLRAISEIVRSLEYIIIYVYFYNVFKNFKFMNYEPDVLLRKNLFVITVVVFSITIIELFNLPGKELLRYIYEMSKSGNIYQYYNRIVSTLRNPNFYGLWLSMIIMYFYTSDTKNITKLFVLCPGVVFLFFTGSRTSWMAFLIALLIVQILLTWSKKGKINIQIFLFFGVALVFYYLVGNYSKLFYSVRFKIDIDAIKSLGGRTQIWESIIRESLENPIFGVGIVKSRDLVFDNLFIQYFYYYGLIGLVFVLFFLLRNLLLNVRLLILNGLNDKFLIFYLGLQVIFIISGFTVQILDVLQISFFYIIGLSYLDYKRLQMKVSASGKG